MKTKKITNISAIAIKILKLEVAELKKKYNKACSKWPDAKFSKSLKAKYWAPIHEKRREIKLREKEQRTLLKDFKKRRRKIFYQQIETIISSIVRLSKEDKEKGLELYRKFQDIFKHRKQQNPLEEEALANLKNQRLIRRKRFKTIVQYRNRMGQFERSSEDFYDLYQTLYELDTTNCWDVEWHASNLFNLKRVFRFFYGYLKNNIFYKIYYKSKYKKHKILNFINNLENRLSIVLYRMNLIQNIIEAKQIIRHGFVRVNGKKIIFSNYIIKENDVISLDKKWYIKEIIKDEKKIHLWMHSYKKKLVEMPYLQVKNRLLTGVYLYNPLNNYVLLANSYPSIFFGSDEIEFDENVRLGLMGKNKYELKNYVKKMVKGKKEKKYEGPFAPFIANIGPKHSRMLLNNIKLINSFFLKV